MLAKADIGGGELVDEAVLDHEFCTDGGFFGRLEQRYDGARPMLAEVVEDRQRPEQGGGVHIVAAGVHVFAIDEQSIKICAHEGSGSLLCGVVAHDGGNAVAAYASGHLEVKALEDGENCCRGAFFLVG